MNLSKLQVSLYWKAFAAACENFVCVCLVSHVPYQLVIGGIKHIVQCHGQFHCAERRTQVTWVLAQLLDNKIAYFCAHLWQGFQWQCLQVAWIIDGM